MQKMWFGPNKILSTSKLLKVNKTYTVAKINSFYFLTTNFNDLNKDNHF